MDALLVAIEQGELDSKKRSVLRASLQCELNSLQRAIANAGAATAAASQSTAHIQARVDSFRTQSERVAAVSSHLSTSVIPQLDSISQRLHRLRSTLQ